MSLDQQIRDLVDGAPAPHRLEDIIRRANDADSDPNDAPLRQRRRAMAVAAAAVVLALVGLGVVRLWPFDDDGRTVDVSTRRATTITPADAALAEWEAVQTLEGEEHGVIVIDVMSDEGILWAVGVGFVNRVDTGRVSADTSVALLWRSTDEGRSWERVGDTPFVTPDEPRFGQAAVTMAASDDRFVVGGYEHTSDPLDETTDAGTAATVWWSDDGRDWERVQLPVGSMGDGATTQVQAIAATAEGFVALGYAVTPEPLGPLVWRSDDGITWKRVAEARFPRRTSFADLAVVGDRLVLVGATAAGNGDAAAWWSDDGGRTWRDAEIDAPDPARFSGMEAVAAGPDGLLAVGARSSNPIFASWTTTVGNGGRDVDGALDVAVWHSTDGRSWVERQPLGGADEVDYDPTVTWGPAGFLVGASSVGPTNEVARSWLTTDGTAWSATDHPLGGATAALAATDSGYIVTTGELVPFVPPGSDSARSNPGVWLLPVDP